MGEPVFLSDVKFYPYHTEFPGDDGALDLLPFRSKVFQLCQKYADLLSEFRPLALLVAKYDAIYKTSVTSVSAGVKKTPYEVFEISCSGFLTLRHGETGDEVKITNIPHLLNDVQPPESDHIAIPVNQSTKYDRYRFDSDSIISQGFIDHVFHHSPLKTSVITNVTIVPQVRSNVARLGYIRLTNLQSLLIPSLNVLKDQDILVRVSSGFGATTGAAISLVQHVVYLKQECEINREGKISPFVIVVSENPQSTYEVFKQIAYKTECVVCCVNCDDVLSEIKACRGVCDIFIANSSATMIMAKGEVIDMALLKFVVCDTFYLSTKAQSIDGMADFLKISESLPGCQRIVIASKLYEKHRCALAGVLRRNTQEITIVGTS